MSARTLSHGFRLAWGGATAALLLAACATGSATDGATGLGGEDSGATSPTPGVDAAGLEDSASTGPGSGTNTEGPGVDSGNASSEDSGPFDPDAGPPAQGTGGGAPTTCAEANGAVGCCGANGDSYYCSTTGTSVKSTTCAGGQVCGWNATKMYYACVAAPGGADPSGAEPMACGGSTQADAGSTHDASGGADAAQKDSATHDANADTGSVSVTPKTCADADDAVGCCGPNGDLYYCKSGSSTVTSTACTGGKVCGWDSAKSYYNCVTGAGGVDPSGSHPIACQ